MSDPQDSAAPRLCLDATPLDTSHRFRGIGTYVSGLLAGMAALGEQLPVVVLRQNRQRGDSGTPLAVRSVWRPPWPPTRLRWLANQLLLPGDLERLGTRLFHATDPRGIPKQPGLGVIATAYDLIPLAMPELYLRTYPWDEAVAYRRSLVQLRGADHIIAISAATQRDLVDRLGISDSKITVVPLGYDATVFRPTDRPPPAGYGLPERYFLYVGAHDPRKNIEPMLRAYAGVRRRLPDTRFVFVGKKIPGEAAVFADWVSRYGLAADIIDLGFVPREDLPALYSRAAAFVFPSLYEGFGLPLLEAMACGCPVIAANNSSIPEVTGEAGGLFAADDAEMLGEWLHRAAEDDAWSRRQRLLSLRQASRFSWRRCAEETLSVYRRCGL